MRSLDIAWLDLKKMLTGRAIVAIAMAVVLVVPLLYGALYLWAFWDPYSHVKDLPVAVVNEDVTAYSTDETVTAGADLVKELLKTKTMRWETMSAKEAAAALKDHTVYMALSVPRDFSSTLASVQSADSTHALLSVTIDEADNMLASQIGARVLSEVRAAASASASEQFYHSMWIGIADARDGMSQAASGAVALSDGIVSARDGALTLCDGLETAGGGSSDLASGLATLSSGTRTLRKGAATARDGASTLASRLSSAKSGASTLDSGARELASGLDTLSSGLGTLAGSGKQLTSSAGSLASAASQVDAGVKSAMGRIGDAANASGQLSSGQEQVVAALEAYAAANPAAASDPAFSGALDAARQVSSGLGSLASQLSDAGSSGSALVAGADQLSDGASRLSSGLDTYAAGVSASSEGASQALSGAKGVSGGTSQLSTGMTAAAEGAARLAIGTSQVAAGASKVASGTVTARAGSVDLLAGITKLTSGAGTLASGLQAATSGSSELQSGLASGVASMPSDPRALAKTRSGLMSDPVALTTSKRTAVANYGTGFAPYFIPLALWVGSLVTFFLLKPINGRALLSGAPDGVVTFSGYWPAALLGSLQAVIMLLVVQLGLGLTLKLPVLTYLLTVLAALAFVALVQCFAFALGSAPGKLVGIALLMLQLTSAAGTFPLQTVPTFFKAIHPYLPMTYVVNGLRQTIAGGDLTVVAHCALALGVFLALGLVGTLAAVHRRRMLTMDQLHPALTM